MKKPLFIFAALLATGLSTAAQDTLSMRNQHINSYFYYGNYAAFYNSGYYPSARGGSSTEGGCIEYAKRFVSDDSLIIYGIAAGVKEESGHDIEELYDESYTYSYEYLRIYRASADSLEYMRQAIVHLGTTPIAYYADFSRPTSQFPYMYIFPVYERYFSSPITVSDTFYAGMTLYTHKYYWDSLGHRWDFHCPPLDLCMLTNTDPSEREYARMQFYHAAGNRWLDGSCSQIFSYIFPILTPPSNGYVYDTTIVGNDTIMVSDTSMAGDTLIVSDTTIVCDTLIIDGDIIIHYDTIVNYDTILGIEDHSLLQRLTGVMPNPAGKTAKVVSSFGMTLVEVYNLAGVKVHTLRLPDAPLTATLDVGRWPSGAYILRIHTPQGIAVKKLAVRH